MAALLVRQHLALMMMASQTHSTQRKALFLRRLSRREEAIESALRSIAAYPWNWSTWAVLGECLGDGEEVSDTLQNIIETEHILAIVNSASDTSATYTSTSSIVSYQDSQQFEQPLRK